MKNKPIKKVKNISVDDLAIMVNKGFSDLTAVLTNKVDQLNEELTNRIEGVEERLTNRMHGFERRMDDIALNRATKDEVYTLGLRVSKIEKKIGI